MPLAARCCPSQPAPFVVLMASAFYSDRHMFEKSLMKLAVTIDVEEEGLFLGKYDSADVPVSNVPELGKLDLLEAFKPIGVTPVSFRMGRFNMGPKMFSILQRTGIRVDSSIAPTQSYYGGPDHRYTPWDPYFPDPSDLCGPGTSR